MDVMTALLSSRVRAEVFRILFGVDASTEVHGRELARRSGVSEASIRQEMGKLCGLDLVTATRNGNRVYYSANDAHPLFQDIHRMVLKTNGLADVLRSVLDDPRIDLAFVFGSIAEGRADAGSDVDLMVLGTVGLRELVGFLSEISAKLGREVNPHVLTAAEYRRRMERGDHFVTNVISGPKIFVVGSDDELEAMARAGLAQG